MPHEKEAAVILTSDKERRARAHATSYQHDSTAGNAERNTTFKMYGYHQKGYKSGWNGGELLCSGSSEVAQSDSTRTF